MRGLALMVAVAAAQQFPARQAPDPKKFAIMAWGDAPPDAGQLRGMREAGLNIAGFCKAQDLDKVRDAGLACFVSDPRISGYDWQGLPPDDEIRGRIGSLVKEIGSNPAAMGFYLRDEPHAALMPGLGRVAKMARQAMPDLWPYVNLFPYRVSPERLGTETYDQYVRLLTDTIGQPFLSYDNYSLVGGEMLDYFYTNLEIVRRLSIETKTPFWNCILANAHFNYMEPSDATFHLQVYATLAYGGRGIQYFTYFAPEVGNYRLAAVDQFGNRTPTWERLRRINLEIQALAPTMLRLRSTGVFHYPDAPEQGKALAASKLVRSIEMRQRFVRPPVAGRFLVGEFEDGEGRPYVMVVNKDLNNSFQFHMQLVKEHGKLMRVSPYSGREEEFGGEMDWLAPGAGVLLRIQ
ncbi:MAG TPA: hypothetical protein VKR61_04270 [Bryobacteraceae bacterium]|nr:hypothetical protein [Bryobacteraceae bacterium]